MSLRTFTTPHLDEIEAIFLLRQEDVRKAGADLGSYQPEVLRRQIQDIRDTLARLEEVTEVYAERKEN